MEDFIKDPTETAASNFFSKTTNETHHSFTQHLQEANILFDQSPMKQNRIQEIEGRMLGLDSILDQFKDHFDKANSDTALDDWHNEKIANLDQIKANNETIEKQLKRDIFFKFEKLDKQLQEMQKHRKELKSKYQVLLSDGIQQVRNLKKTTFKELTQLKDEKHEIFKKNNSLFKKQLQKLKKSQKNAKNQTFGSLELVRNKFQERLRNEESKRENLDNIIQFLMEKTCKKAQDTIQRKLYEYSSYAHLKI